MNKHLKKITGITLGILFIIFLGFLPTILIQGTVQSVRLAVKIKNIPENRNKQQPPIAAVEPIEKELFFHFLPGERVYSLETIDQDATCTNCRGKKTKQLLPEARTPAAVVKEAADAQAGIISTTCSDSPSSCDYAYSLAKIAKQNNLAVVFSYDGCLGSGALKKILPLVDAVKIESGSQENNYCQFIAPPLDAAMENIKAVKDAGKHLELSYLINAQNASGEMVNKFLNELKLNAGPDAIIHFSSAARGEQTTSTETIKHARDLALQAGFKYVYTSGFDFPAGENTFCADGSVALERQNKYLLKNNLKNGVCADGTVIPGVWK